MYRIEDIDFQLSPNSKFALKGGTEVSYQEYYEKKYNRKLKFPDQPLLINLKRKDGTVIHLVPELCVLTGQSPEMRLNFQLQKDLATIITPTPNQRLIESQKLLEFLKKNEQTKTLINKWNIQLSIDPLKIESEKLVAGNILMGKNNQFPLENTPGFDQRIQTEMLEQPEIVKIGVFVNKRDAEAGQAFLDTLKECVNTFNYPMARPKEFYVEGRNFEDWQYSFKKNLDPTVQAVILLLPGAKKKSPFYDQCKHYLLTKCPIPSQVVLVPTITSGRNLRSIVNKVLIQICAKVGGTPWSVMNFPFAEKPTMIVGIDVFHQAPLKREYLLSYCGTINRHFSRYWSTVSIHNSYEDVGFGIQEAVKSSINDFRNANRGIFPVRMIVYRDGVADSQQKVLKETEVHGFLRAFEDLYREAGMTTKPELIFVCVNKRVNAKFFSGDNLERGTISNPDPGTVVTDEITSGNDFYLISQKSQQGSVTPTHYTIIGYYITINGEYVEVRGTMHNETFRKLQLLTYKLCFMYYNWSGSIKVPAPAQYASKLSTLIGERWRPSNPMIPDKAFEKYKSLYFI